MSDLVTANRRQAGLTALYLGVFAMVWFSVPAAEQPLRALLVVGSIVALLTAVLGGVLAARLRGVGSPRDRAADRPYLLIVVAEFAAAGLGAAVLVAADWTEYVPVLVCLVVGLHFFPLAPLLRDPLLRPLGGALCLVAAAGLVTGLASAVSAGLVVGVGAGVLLLGYAVQALVRAHRPA
ncbi:hypothetical protein ACQPWW_27045 [Micromonospora sp. CA-240977]|uniref:hypothetical protein n=1 Tax=Micromonospora sp. CA-240977 TaxID=3239957 RepID=UPI003D8DEF97